MYLVSCLIKLFTLATKTYEEQHRHVEVLQNISNSLYQRSNSNAASGAGGGVNIGGAGASLLHPFSDTPANPHLQAFHNDISNWQVADEDYLQLRDDGPIDIDESSSQDNEGGGGGAGDTTALLDTKPRRFSNVLSPRPKRQHSSQNNAGGAGGGGTGSGGNANFMDAISNNVFTRSLFSSGSTHQITSPGGSNPHAPLMFGNRSVSHTDLAVNQNNSGGGVDRTSSNDKLLVDIPLMETGMVSHSIFT